MLIVTSFSAAILAILLVVLAILCIFARGRFKVALSDNGELALIKFIRAHANLTEFAPIFLILIGLVELNHFIPIFWLWVAALLFIVGRVAHALSLLFIEPKTLVFRQIGMGLTFITILKLAFILLVQFVLSLIWVKFKYVS